MSKFTLAASYIKDTYDDDLNAQYEDRVQLSEEAARRLNDAGLLAPDLPTLCDDYDSIEVPTRRTLIMDDADCPTLYEDEDSLLVGITEGGDVEFSLGMCDEVFVTLTIDKARRFAHALLATANHAKGNQE